MFHNFAILLGGGVKNWSYRKIGLEIIGSKKSAEIFSDYFKESAQFFLSRKDIPNCCFLVIWFRFGGGDSIWLLLERRKEQMSTG